MFGWFRAKEKPPLVFSDNRAAFDHACGLGYQPLNGALIPALVEEEGQQGDEGERYFRLSLALAGVSRELWACTLKEARDHPVVGELVGFRIVKVASDLPEPANLIGYIACGLEPVLVVKKGWRVAKSYTPADIKPELHW